MIKIAFLNNVKHGELSKLDKDVMQLAHNNKIDIQQVGANDKYDYLIGDSRAGSFHSLNTPTDFFKCLSYSACWGKFGSNKSISDNELFSVFEQCISKHATIKKLGFDILYSLNPTIYSHIQQFIAQNVEPPTLTPSNYEIYLKLTYMKYKSLYSNNLSLNLLGYINIYCVTGEHSMFFKLCEKVFQTHSICLNKNINFSCSLAEKANSDNFDISTISV